MSKTKKGSIFIGVALSLAVVLVLYFTGINFQRTKILTRTVELKETSIDYQSFFIEFEDAKLILDENKNTINFSGSKKIDSSIFEEYDLVSSNNTDNSLNIRYIFDYNADTNEFYLSVIADTENGAIIDNWFGVPFMTNENIVDIAFATDDGVIYLSELEESGVLNNCGWFSKLLKVVAVAAVVIVAVAVVAAVIIVAAPAIAAAGAAVSSAVAVGGGAAALTGGTAAAALSAAAAAGAAAMGTTAFAIAATTAVAATAIASAAIVVDQRLQIVEDYAFSNPLKKVRQLATSMLSSISTLIMDRVYQFAYLDVSGLIIMPLKLNYIEAYAVLVASGLINVSSTGAITQEIKNFVLPASLITLINTIKSKGIKAGYCGIYTISESNAAKLAYAAGGFFKGKAESEVHDSTPGSGYYYHFHDFTHSIHVWYGYAF